MEVRSETGFRLLAFVVMPDRCHLVLSALAERPLPDVVRLIKGRFARRYNLVTGSSGALWQSRYHERTLRSETELISAVEYVHANPVSSGLSAAIERYPWSWASGHYPIDLAAYLSQAEA